MHVYREIKTFRLTIHYMHLRVLFCHNHYFLSIADTVSCLDFVHHDEKIKENSNVFLTPSLHTLMFFLFL